LLQNGSGTKKILETKIGRQYLQLLSFISVFFVSYALGIKLLPKTTFFEKMEIKKYTNADLLRFTKNLIEKQTNSTTNHKIR
jgi:hypothetical protein